MKRVGMTLTMMTEAKRGQFRYNGVTGWISGGNTHLGKTKERDGKALRL